VTQVHPSATRALRHVGSFLLWTLCLRLLSLRRLKQREILAVAFFFQFIHRNEPQRGGVYAVALAGWSGTVIKDMAEMRIACFATNLGAFHSEGRILLFGYLFWRNGLGETGPACAAVEFIKGTKQRFARDNIDINAGLVIVPVSIVKRGLGAALPGDVILIFGQLAFQLGVAGNWLVWIHFFGFFFLRLSITKQDRADNHKNRAKHTEPQSFTRPMCVH